jgi:hypothetical protein
MPPAQTALTDDVKPAVDKKMEIRFGRMEKNVYLCTLQSAAECCVIY